MRTKARIPVRIEGLEGVYVTEDVSEGGVSIKGELPLSVDQAVRLTFEFSDRCLILDGRIRYVKNGKTGIEFEKPFKGLLVTLLSAKGQAEALKDFAEELAALRKGKIRRAAQEIGKSIERGYHILRSVFIAVLLIGFAMGLLGNWVSGKHRERLIREMERERGSVVIPLVHRTERVGLFGIPVKQYIRQEDADAILQVIRSVPPGKPIDLIVHTPGGVLTSAYQIAKALKEHKGKVTVFIPHYAMSGGTLIALAADEIVLGPNAMLGPVDPQISMGGKRIYPAVSVIRMETYKPLDEFDDETLILYDQALKAERQVEHIVRYLLKDRPGVKIEAIIKRLVSGETTHDFPLFYEDAKALGLPVSTDMPPIVYRIMETYLGGGKN